MRRIQTKVNEINQTFEVKLNSNTSFKTKLQKDNKIIPVKNESSKSSFNIDVDNKDNSVYAKTDINNTPEEDTWYDEIIYYDGGGVEGYGD
jgi:hypothetical protein